MDRTCSNCRFWARTEGDWQDGTGIGDSFRTCLAHINEGDRLVIPFVERREFELAYGYGRGDEAARGIVTAPDFGCVTFEPQTD